ncbi:MAG: 50S ribosomal protein L4 [Christensenellales bacterium]|jgi:large subunit ribosomal protein L4
MPKVALYNMDGATVGELELADEVFSAEVNADVIHQVVTALLNNKRQGTQSALTRSEVRGGGRKPYRQKGTGRARQGTIRAPQHRHGGVVFAPQPRSYRVAINKKVRRLATKGALSEKVAAGNIIVLDELKLSEGKTKEMVKLLANLKVDNKALLVLDDYNENALRASGNLPGVKTSQAELLNVLDIVDCDKFIITKAAAMKVQEVFA